MKVTHLLPFLSATALTATAAPADHPHEHEFAPPRRLLTNGDASAPRNKIPTSRESALLGRRILALTPLATFSTVFPSSDAASGASGVAGLPIGLSDYVADCEDGGNPTILSLSIGTTFQNVRHGSNISVSYAWVPPYPPSRRIRSTLSDDDVEEDDEDDDERGRDPMPYSGANLPRFSLMGYLEKVEASSQPQIAACYVAAHPDAKYWLPGNRIHHSEWVRLVVTKVYWIGGFGDRAYIGWIPVDEWAGVSRDEWEAARLPGEKPGWKEWSLREEAATWFKDL